MLRQIKIFISILIFVPMASDAANDRVQKSIDIFLRNPSIDNFKKLDPESRHNILATTLTHGPTDSLREDRSTLVDWAQNKKNAQMVGEYFQSLSEIEKRSYYGYLYHLRIQDTAFDRPNSGVYLTEFEGIKTKTAGELQDLLFQLATQNDHDLMNKIFCDSFKTTALLDKGLEVKPEDINYKEVQTYQNERQVYKKYSHLIPDNCTATDARGRSIKFSLVSTISSLEVTGQEPRSTAPSSPKETLLRSNPHSYDNKSYCTEKQIRSSVNEALNQLYTPKITTEYFYRFNENDCVIYLDFRKESISKKSSKSRWNVYDIYSDMTDKKGVKLNSDSTFDKEDIISSILKRQAHKSSKKDDKKSVPDNRPTKDQDDNNVGGALFSPFAR